MSPPSHPPFAASRLWYPYQQVYSKVDLMYGTFPSSLGPNAFGHGQSVLNVVELLLNVRRGCRGRCAACSPHTFA